MGSLKYKIMQEYGKYIIGLGILIIVVGIIFVLFGNKLGWIGNLPGDIKVDRGNFKFYMPITTMILLSVLASLLLRLFRKLL